jgi:uncharacterized protein YeaO (DUF488 family)
MIYTSYFANHRKHSKFRKKVSISLYPPKWFKADIQANELVPSKKLLLDYKNNLINNIEYEKIYREETLSKLDPEEIYSKYNECIFLCYERSNEFCHRQIVSAWLKENGFDSKELSGKNKNIAIIGSRTFDNYPLLKKIMDRLIFKYENVTIISGHANGADKLAEQYAKENNLDKKIFLADWGKYGKNAGYIRNHTIWENSDLGVAFWDGESKGTKHSFEISKKMNKPLYVFNYIKSKWVKI